jgi:transposase
MRQVKLPPELDTLIAPIMSVLDELGTKLLKVHDRLEQLCAQEPAILQLTTVHGVGLVVAAIFVSVIDEARRFESRHQVGSYLGLVPSEYSSGDTRRVGAITRCGNRYVRAALIQAAWSYMRNGPDDPIKQWAHQVAGRRGRRIAVIALARRLACIMWAMWRDGTVYDANLVGKRPALRREQSLELRAGALGRAKHKTRALAQRVERAARP